MDHPTENYDAVFFNISSFLDPEVRTALGLVSRSSATLRPRLQGDNAFWKKRFEELTGTEYARDLQPGRTTWRWKVEALERDGAKGLLLSPELLDIKIGHSMLSDEGVDLLTHREKKWIANYALATGDEEIIRYLTSEPVFLMKEFSKEALKIGIEYLEPTGNRNKTYYDEEGVTYYDDMTVPTAKLLLDLFYGSAPDIEEIIIEALEHQGLPIVAFYLHDPRALLPTYGDEYLEFAWSHNRDDIFYYLLDLPDVQPTAGLIGDIWDEDNEEEMQKLREHPKTAALMGTH